MSSSASPVQGEELGLLLKAFDILGIDPHNPPTSTEPKPISNRRLALPGLSVELPVNTTYRLLFHAEKGDLVDHVALIVEIPDKGELIGASSFAWAERDDPDKPNNARTKLRELQNDSKERAEPLVKLTLTAQAATQLVLADFPLDGGLPVFFRQYLGESSAPGGLAVSRISYGPLQGATWKGELKLNVTSDNFRLPFLERGGDQAQCIEIDASGLTQVELGFEPFRAEMAVGLKVTIGDLQIATEFKLEFNLETFALEIDHDIGIDLYASDPYEKDFLGLKWSFDAPQIESGAHKGKRHFLTLVTKNNHYQIQQAPGAVFRVAYAGISEEPLGFAISDFVLGAQGLSLRATVDEVPVRLRGVDTKFRFSNCGFEMRDSKIVAFTLGGSGSLPPDLVGDADVDIFLGFGPDESGHMSLLAGTAALRGNKLLQCKGTRFEFTITKLGLSFVQEGSFHLYFTLSGSAQLKLAPTDEREGLLMLLPTITIEMVDCPLAGDIQVLAKHIKFQTTLPKAISFSLLGCFEMELRGFGFVPHSPEFDGDPAMCLSGQIKFAQGAGDVINADIEFHSLYIGLPEPGGFLPRIYLEKITVNVKKGDAFELNATVKFVDEGDQKGFAGEGSLSISGLPRIDATFGFMRVREDADSPWVRAWFIYAQASELSLKIPVVEIYIREIGLGFGYRYTLAMIKAADEANKEGGVRAMLKQLDELATSQGNLASIEAWEVDVGGAGDPRWTIVLRAMFSQTAASSPTSLDKEKEKELPCVFLFDAVLAFRSDLTFLMTARGWLNTNYVDYIEEEEKVAAKPFMTAYMLLSVPQKRFLARISTNPGGYIGDHPPMADFMKKAIEGLRFRATLLIEPGLFHLDLGWPNQLAWEVEVAPFKLSVVGGFIYRVSRDDLVIGVSYLARGTLDIDGGVSFGLFGVHVYAHATLAYGMRFIGVLSFRDPAGKSLFYGAIGLELQIKLMVEFWLNLLFKKFRANFSFEIAFSAALELGLEGASLGVRGSGSLALKVCGRSFRVTINVSANEGTVAAALSRTQEYLAIGLDADDSGGPPEPVPGTTPAALGAAEATAFVLGQAERQLPTSRWPGLVLGAAPDKLEAPHYSAVVMSPDVDSSGECSYFVIFPRSTPLPAAGADQATAHCGFLPARPAEPQGGDFDFVIEQLGAGDDFVVEHYDPTSGGWVNPDASGAVSWKADWGLEVDWDGQLDPGKLTEADRRRLVAIGLADDPSASPEIPLRVLVREAFVGEPGDLRDPEPIDMLGQSELADHRVYNPSESDFEAAVRGAHAQFAGSPFFKHDPSLEYDRQLDMAFSLGTSIYAPAGSLSDEARQAAGAAQRADQMRGLLVNDSVAVLRAYAAAKADRRQRLEQHAPAFRLGLVFRFTLKKAEGAAQQPEERLPSWLTVGDNDTSAARPLIRQRMGAAYGPQRELRVFNPPETSFAKYSPSFSRVRHYTNASTIGIAWDLTWESPPKGCADEQADPEHHLAFYRVLRRALDSNERDLVYTVKSAQVLNRTSADVIEVLRPRFQIVDHFGGESPAELAALPEAGLSYLYTITPMDYAGNAGRPLTLIATRYPDRPPQVPTDAVMTVSYTDYAALKAAPVVATAPPPVLDPATISVAWTEQPARYDETRVPVRGYRLIFRRSDALPVGSYGLDHTTQRGAQSLVGLAMARPLPTDIVVELPSVTSHGQGRSGTIGLELLRNHRVFPPGPNGAWRADSWQVFIQAIALNGVPSALAPVQLALTLERAPSPESGLAERLVAERQPAELEWLPRPATLPLVRPEDQRAQNDLAHFPMPIVSWDDQEMRYVATFDTDFSSVRHLPHPDAIRCVRLRWNQGPSDSPGYPVDLTAGFHLAELDIDAHTSETFLAQDRLSEALRVIQEVRMAPAADLPLLPRDTLATKQWEAWYPSAMMRRTDLPGGVEWRSGDQAPQPLNGAHIPRSAWYSWRESLIAWPSPSVAGEPPWRSGALHPLLQRLVDRLNGVLLRVAGGDELYASLDSGIIPDSLMAVELGLTDDARLRTASPGFSWRIDDDKNNTGVFTYPDGSSVKARRLRIQKIDSGVEVAVLSPYFVDLQQVAVAQQGTFEDFLAATSPKSDPYGWGVLQLFGLSATFALRDVNTAQPMLGGELLAAVREALDAIWAAEAGKFAALKPHLFAELLFQPGRSIELKRQDSSPDRLLANVQISLRPTIRQARPYASLSLSGTSGKTADIVFKLAEGQVCDVIMLEGPAGVEQRLLGSAGDGSQTLSIAIPAGGSATLLIRGDEQVTRVERDEQGKRVVSYTFAPRLPTIEAADGAAALISLDPTDSRLARFTAPSSDLAQNFAASLAGQEDPAAWQHFASYVGAVYSSAATRIVAPSDAFDIGKVIGQYLDWAQRFFDAAGAMTAPAALPGGASPAANTASLVAQYGPGPWLATAYPRAGTPAYATPDAGGRLTYDHLIPDRWAHTLRYYIKPYGRYERMTEALLDELKAETARGVYPAVVPDPQAGGLDVVIDRTERLAAPLVLYSGRLDEAALPGRPVPPGSTWEVIIAQHPEQRLSERNQLLRRRLSYRQVAFTLLRRLADAAWVANLEGLISPGDDPARFTFRYVESQAPDIPQRYPEVLDQIDLPALRGDEAGLGPYQRELRAAERRSLDLPLRIARFQEGALAVQWEALPFYYAHRLLLVAQSDTVVSPITEVTQRDFEYCSPRPAAAVAGRLGEVALDRPFAVGGESLKVSLRHYEIRIPLRRLWDSLPREAKRRWPGERPGSGPYGERRPFASLPDPEVVYQLTQRFSGNVEVQAEYFCAEQKDGATKRAYAGRRLGERVIASESPTFCALKDVEGDYTLAADLVIYTELALSKAYEGVSDLGPLAFRKGTSTLLVAGPLTREQREGLIAMVGADTPDGKAIETLFNSWYSVEPVSYGRPLDAQALGETLGSLVTQPPAPGLALVWGGPISAAQREDLLKLKGDGAFLKAVEALVEAAQKASHSLQVTVATLVPREFMPAALPPGLAATGDPGEPFSALTWSGPMSVADRDTLLGLSDDPELAESLESLCHEAFAAQAALTSYVATSKGLEQLPLTLIGGPATAHGPQPPLDRLRVELDPKTRRYSSVVIEGYLFDKAKDDIGAALASEKQLISSLASEKKIVAVPQQDHPIVALSSAVDSLFASMEARVLTAEARVRPTQAGLPGELGKALVIDERAGRLRWTGDAPTADERKAISTIVADRAFVRAIAELLTKLVGLDKTVSVSLPEGAAPVSVPPELGVRLSLAISESSATLRWAGALPSAAERGTLAALWAGTPFAQLASSLASELNKACEAALPAPPPPLEKVVQLQEFGGQLVISTSNGVTSFQWSGRVHNAEQAAAIEGLFQQSEQMIDYRALALAYQTILSKLQGPFGIAITIEARPEQAALPESLCGSLLIGRGRISYHGLMSEEEAHQLRKLYAADGGAAIDGAAIERLYQASLRRLARLGELSIRARRANATPSALAPLGIAPLAAETVRPSDEGE